MNVAARVVHTAFAPAGKFICSNEILNQLQSCFLRSYVSNFVGIPTDCPHREKCGWTGDALLVAESGLLNYASATAYTQWLANFPNIQRANGQMHGVIPYCEGVLAWESGTPWDAALILLPWYIYLYTGDLSPAVSLYDAMKKYLEFCSSQAEGNIVEFGLDDWCHPRSENEHPWKERNASYKAPLAMLCTAYYYSACKTFAKFAGLMGKHDDQYKYEALTEDIRDAFNERFYQGNGIYANGCQTALGCALYHELVDPEYVQLVAEKLNDVVQANDYKVDYGLVGSKYVLRVLADHGYICSAYKMLTQSEFPGYAHWLKLGATTLFEQWDGTKSRNHPTFGDFSAWLYCYLAGIVLDPDNPGFKHIKIQPHPFDDLQWVKAEHTCCYGKISVCWEKTDTVFILDVDIPPQTTATIMMPDTTIHNVTSGEYRFATTYINDELK